MVHFACPSCGAGLKTENDQIGKLCVCPRCRADVEIPCSLGELACPPTLEPQPPIPPLVPEPDELPVVYAESLETGRELVPPQEEQDYEEESIPPASGNRYLSLIGALGATGILALLGLVMLSAGKSGAALILELSQRGVAIFLDGKPIAYQNPNDSSVIINDLEPGRRYRIRAEKRGHIPYSRMITPNADEPMRIAIQLEREPPPPLKPPFIPKVESCYSPSAGAASAAKSGPTESSTAQGACSRTRGAGTCRAAGYHAGAPGKTLHQ